jgi:TolB protein
VTLLVGALVWLASAIASAERRVHVSAVDSRDRANELEPSWSPDGKRIAFTRQTGAGFDVYVMNADGTGQRNLTRSPADESDPAWSPSGNQIAYGRDSSRSGDGSDIFVMNVDGSGRSNLTPGPASENAPAWDPAWSPDGKWIVYGGGEALRVMRRNGSGDRELRSSRVGRGGVSGASWSPDGKKIAFETVPWEITNNVDIHSDIFVVDPAGGRRKRLTKTTFNHDPAWSPDGKRIAFTQDYDDEGVFVMNADGSGRRNLTRSRGYDMQPAWSPNGTRIAFANNRDGDFDLFVMNADGSNQRRLTR